MKKITVILFCVSAAAVICAAPVSMMSKDPAAVKAALKTSRAAFHRIGYTLRLRELEGKLKINNYSEFERAVLHIGTELKIVPADIEDAKVVVPYMTGRFAKEAFRSAHRQAHPYELRYMLRTQMYSQAKELMPEYKDRYMRMLYLLKWNAAKYHAWGGRCANVILALEYMDKCADSGRIARYKNDLEQLKAVFKRWRYIRPEQWQPVYDWIDRRLEKF